MSDCGRLRIVLLMTASLAVLTAASMPPAVAQDTAHAGSPPGAAPSQSERPAQAHEAAEAQSSGADSVIVTGTRDLHRTARQSTSPIDILTGPALTRSGQPQLAEQIVRVDPSVNIQTESLDTAALTSSIRLRGLNPNQVLVLVDGVRRHQTANIYADAGPEQGSTPVDINMIPAASIDHIEILRDGAAALYGSDAIAGVINIITKKTDHGGSFTAESGADAYNGDGWQYQIDADKGASFGSDGYVHLGGQLYHADHSVFPTSSDEANANLLAADRSPAGAFPANSDHSLSTPEETRETLSIEAGETLASGLWGGLAGFTLVTYGHRHAESYENYRDPTVSPETYPGGFSPLETDEENDYAVTAGLKADDVAGFHVKLSTTFGRDDVKIGNKNTANPTLYDDGYPTAGLAGGFTPTTVFAQGQHNSQWTNNLDITRLFHLDTMPLSVAFGAEHRLDEYSLDAGEPASYVLGGTQGFSGLLPASAGEWNRDVYAGYVDIDVHPVPKLDVDLAGRFEHYTDFGNTENGKLSSRYDFTNWIALRGTISNGFRAPTLAEEHFSQLNVGVTGASGDLAVDSAAARSIGAVPLKPERSTNASAGVVIQPTRNLSVTVDVYQISLRDRIVGAGGIGGTPALNAIALTGATLPAGITTDDVSAYYVANGASMRTQGLDRPGSYLVDLDRRGTLLLTLGLDLNRTRLHHLGTDAFGNPFLNAEGIGFITTAFPRSKLILNAFWRIGGWDLNLRQARYGQTSNELQYEDQAPADLQYSTTSFLHFIDAPRWLTDIEIGYRLSQHWHIAVGGNNVFNILPSRTPLSVSYLNVGVFDDNAAQIPFTGGFYYGRVNYTF